MNMNSDPVFLRKEIAARKGEKKPDFDLDDKSQYFALKRIFDIVISFIFIVAVLSWLAPIIALLIIIDSGGPVFFFQKRVGKRGSVFICYKFRTMILNSDADRLQALPHDKRITFIGNILRRSNLDELPQFFNVLMGDMSIVG